MKASGKIDGIDNLILTLRNIADKVDANARGAMKRSADRIVNEAKINCPEDSGDLVKSIRQTKSYEDRDSGGHGGRLQIEITYGGVVDGEDIDDYANLIHENYESLLKHGPGQNTLAKMAAYPDYIIGSKFLSRAAEGEEPKLADKMIKVVRSAIEGKDEEPLPEIAAPPAPVFKTHDDQHKEREVREAAKHGVAGGAVDAQKDVLRAARGIASSRPGLAIGMTQLRAAVPHVGREDFDQAILSLRQAMKLNPSHLDNPRDIAREQESGVLNPRNGDTYHIVWPI